MVVDSFLGSECPTQYTAGITELRQKFTDD